MTSLREEPAGATEARGSASSPELAPGAATTSEVFVVALNAAAIAAFLHIVVFTVQLHVFDRRTFSSPELLWIAPFAYALWFLALAVPLAFAARLWSGVFTLAAIVGINSGVVAFALLLLYPAIHPVAYVVLGAGVGSQVARLVRRRPEPWRRNAWRVAAGLTALLFVAASIRDGWHRLAEHRALSAERTAEGDAPNVLVLILDTVRAANLSLYGYERPTTPVLEALAREGVVYERAFSPAAWTLPSHASMLSGYWAAETGTSYVSSIPSTLPMVTERMRERGYITAGFIGNAGWAGWETGFNRGFHHFETYPLSRSQLLCCTTFMRLPFFQEIVGGVVSLNGERIAHAFGDLDFTQEPARSPDNRPADAIVARFLAWREKIGDQHPYFAVLNLFDAHDPDPPAPFRTMFKRGDTRLDRYDGSLAFMDSIIGELVSVIRERGELDQTVLIITSDHGEQFGEHGLTGHGNSVYVPVVHTPLLIRYPRRMPAGLRRPEIVSLRDLAATILDLSEAPADARIRGHSLACTPEGGVSLALLVHASRAINKPEQRNARGPIQGLLNDDWHYVRYADGSEELFAWRTDPAELENLANSTRSRDVLPALRARTAELLGQGGEGRYDAQCRRLSDHLLR